MGAGFAGEHSPLAELESLATAADGSGEQSRACEQISLKRKNACFLEE